MKSKSITKPVTGEYPAPYAHYVEMANTNDLLRALKNNKSKFVKFFNSIDPAIWIYRYAEGKWSVKEILLHMIDSERIFSYRALRFARNDKTELPGFNENLFAPNSNADKRTAKDLISEYEAVRNATISLFKTFEGEVAVRSGVTNGVKISVRSLGYAILGHELHHINVIKERYLKKR